MPAEPVEASVIIPALNGAAYIEQQLLALAKQQTRVPWELVVADNGSTDNTLAIVERIAGEMGVPVTVDRTSAGRGLAAARNAGAGAAAGELLLFTDADDVVDEQWVDEMVRALRVHPFVGGRVEVLTLNGEEVASWRQNVFDDGLPTVGGRPWALGCNFGCTADAFATIEGFNEEIVGWDDVDFALAMAAHGMPAAFAERAVVHYRYRSDPAQAIRQMWSYGRHSGLRYARYGIEPPTVVDALAVFFRRAKRAVRDLIRGRRPVGPVVDATYFLGEASMLLRSREFWRPAYRVQRPANPWLLQWDRLGRLGGLIASRVRG